MLAYKNVFLPRLGGPLLLLLVTVVTGCRQQVDQSPIYPDSRSISIVEAVSFGDTAPHFGAQLEKASGQYYLAEGNLNTIGTWYDRQTAEYRLVHVDEHQTPGVFHRLYRVGVLGSYTEVIAKKISPTESLLLVYDGLGKPDRDASGNGWLRKMWGFLLGWTGPSLADALFEWITNLPKPIRPLYETILLKPILNSLLTFRWLFPWDFSVLILLFVFLLAFLVDLIQGLIRKLTGLVVGKKANLWLVFFINVFIIFLVTEVFVAAAIWESLNAQYDVSPSGQFYIQSLIYPFLSDDIQQVAANPPTSSFLSARLDKPNVVLAPVALLILGALTYYITLALLDTQAAVLKDADPEKADFIAGWYETLTEGSNCQEAIGSIIRDAAIVVFLPLGVALYFIASKVLSVWSTGLNVWDLSTLADSMKEKKPYKQPSNPLRWFFRISLVLLFVVWLAFVDRGVSWGRATRLFQQPTDVIRQVTVIYVTPTSEAKEALKTTERSPSLTTPTRSPTPTRRVPIATPMIHRGIVTANMLNARAGPGTNYEVVRQIPNGTEVEIVGRDQTGNWLRIKLVNGNTPWVYIDYIDTNSVIGRLPVLPP